MTADRKRRVTKPAAKAVATAAAVATMACGASVTAAAAPQSPVPWAAPPTLACPDRPDPLRPTAPIPPRDPRCGVNDMEIVPGLHYRSNAFYRQGTFLADWGSLTTFGSTHWQLRDAKGQLRAGQPKPAHIPFGPEIAIRAPRPPSKTKGNSARHITVSPLPGVTYTADINDLSAFLDTPMGSLIVRAPQTPYPHLVPVNNWQAVNKQGQYMMGSTLTFAEPQSNWPLAVQPPGPEASNVAQAGAIAKPKNRVPPDQGGIRPEPRDPNDDINQGINNVATQTGLAVSIGGVVGGVTGLAIGCAFVGGAAALGTASAADFGGTAPLTGCILGAVAFGAIGATIGGAVLGLPVLVASGIAAYNDLHYNKKVVAKPEAKTMTAAAAWKAVTNRTPAHVKPQPGKFQIRNFTSRRT